MASPHGMVAAVYLLEHWVDARAGGSRLDVGVDNRCGHQSEADPRIDFCMSPTSVEGIRRGGGGPAVGGRRWRWAGGGSGGGSGGGGGPAVPLCQHPHQNPRLNPLRQYLRQYRLSQLTYLIRTATGDQVNAITLTVIIPETFGQLPSEALAALQPSKRLP